MTRRLWLWILFLVAVALWWLTSRPPLVSVAYPQQTRYQTEVALTGILSPWERELGAPMAGRVQSLPVIAGARVRRGQVLAVVEDPAAAAREAQASSLLAQALRRLDAASAELPGAEEQLRLARAAVEAAQGQLRQAREEARRNRREQRRQGRVLASPQADPSPARRPRAGRRFRNLQAGPEERPGAPGERRGQPPLPPELQAARQNIEAARAQFEEARRRLRQLQEEIRRAQAEAQGQQELLRGLRPRASLLAPADGILTAVLVQKGDPVTASAPLVRVSVSDRLQVLVPGSHLQVVPGQGVRVAAEGQVLAGKIGQVDEKGVTVLVPNPDRRLSPGDRVQLDLGTCTVEALAVPAQALVGGSVWVVKGEVVRRRPVRTGPAQGALVLVEEGLSPADAVVVKGFEGLREGQPVRVELP